jgi:hypothetical protein
MPVIECTCGMMMSLSSTQPRTCCIRCGGVEFRLVEKYAAHRPQLRGQSTDTSGKRMHSFDMTAIGLVVAQPIAAQPCI